MFKTLLVIILLTLFAWLVLSNATAVTIHFFIWEYTVSLAIVILLSFVFGILVAGIMMLGSMIKRRRASNAKQQTESKEFDMPA